MLEIINVLIGWDDTVRSGDTAIFSDGIVMDQ